MAKTLTLSIVIPVYNEESNIRQCLSAIGRQTVMPEEVILVDNNCTDRTIEIAREYKFVKIIKETTQGMIPARNAGFNAVRSDIIGRIDADTVLGKNWVKNAKKAFASEDVMGLAGLSKTKLLPIKFNHFYGTIWNRFYYMWREFKAGTKVLWGANMAIRRTAWEKIRDEACMDDKIVHEDQDLSYLMAKYGLRVRWTSKMLARTDELSYHDWPKFLEYYQRAEKTYSYHKEKGNIPGDKSVHLNLYQRGWRIAVVFLPALFFAGTSYLKWFFRLKRS